MEKPAEGEEPLVSIIINNYNYGEFLGDAIESALGQTYARTEVVVVDDGSTDNSRDVIALYGNRIVSVFKDNGGQGSAYNAGFASSRGEVVCFLDSDDTLYPDAMDRAANALRPGDAKVQWPLDVTDRSGQPTGELSTRHTPPEGDLRELVISGGPFYDFHLHTGCAMARSFLDAVMPVPEPPYRNGADVYLITLAPVFGQIRNIVEPLGTYRAHGANNHRDRVLDHGRVLNHLGRFETNAAVLREFLARQGVAADVAGWKQRNFNYLWPSRLIEAKRRIGELLPEGTRFILVDSGEWGDPDPVPGRRAVPFLERDGVYWGAPTDDHEAMTELDRLREEGATFLVVWWTCFWWREHYPEFFGHLQRRFPCVAESDAIVVYDLRP